MRTDLDKPQTSGPGNGNSGDPSGNTIGFGQPKSAVAIPNPVDASRPLSPKRAAEPEDAAPAPKRSRHARNRFVVFFNFLVSSAVFTTLLILAVLYFGKNRFVEPGPLQVPRSIVVAEGSSLATISTQLEARGIVDSEMVFRLGVRAYQAQSQMQAGEYAFKPSMSMFEVMETLRSGKGIIYKVSVPEGLTSFQIMQRIKENEVLVGEMPNVIPAEGSLMPDTYPFQRGMSRTELIEQMARAQKIFLEKIWERRVPDLPISTPEEMVILASIVEKETARADERPHVASVFINRLNLGMKLQSDPTIIYGLFGGEGKPKDRPIYKSDITKATDYNTYVIDALPPGPIANPGRASLEAVANPSKTEDLFFVADGTGGHVFAKTLAEHNANVVRWRAIEKRMKAEAAKKAEEKATDDSTDANQAQSN